MVDLACSKNECEDHAVQRSLYRHALNALQLASRSACASNEARDLAERCAAMLRAANAAVSAPVVEHP